jgi:hypothetical protein
VTEYSYTVVLTEKDKVRAWRRFNNLAIACAAGELEPEAKRASDYTVVSAGTNLRPWKEAQLDQLLAQRGGVVAQMSREQKEQVVKTFLLSFDTVHTALSEQAAKAHAKRQRAQPPPESAPAAPEETEVTQVQTSKKGKSAAKGKKPVTAKVAKPRAKGKSGGDGLGREGTPARFIREAYKAGKETDEIFKAVVKKFPKNEIKDKGYVSWYFHDMVRKGLINKH